MKKNNIFGLIVQIVIAMFVVWLTALLTPGISATGGLGTLFWAALAIGVIQWALSNFLGLDRSPIGKGLSGFLVTAVVLYGAGMVVSGLNVTLIGALIGALILGVVEALIPSGVFRS
ncbi:MAG: phage holin family protein [Tissierellia bacterium]|nr:phage holin family protein [Tissierellia bacterium]